MKKPIRVLIVEDSEFDARVLVNTLRQGGYDPTFRRVETAETLQEALRRETWDVVLSDYNLPHFNAAEALRVLQQTGLDLPFIIISGGIGEDIAVAAMKAGAHDYLMKGNLARLVPAVEREMREATTRCAARRAEEDLRDSEQRNRLLWENSTDAVLMMEPDGTIRFANPAVRAVFGYAADEVVGESFSRLLAPEARESFAHWGEACLADTNGGVDRQPIETVGRHRDRGDKIFLEIGFNTVDLKGRRYLVAFIRDISERRRAEEESRLLRGVSLVVNSVRDAETALSLVLHTICEATGWSMGQVWLPSADGRALECSSSWHSQTVALQPFRRASEGRRFAPGEGLAGRVWEQRKAVWMPDLSAATNSPRAAVAREVGIVAAAGIPVLADDRVVAVLEFFLREHRDEDHRMLQLLSDIAAQLGVAIQQKRAEAELQANEEEFRAARDIQERLFPKAPPLLRGFELAGTSQAASAAGGDYYDYLPIRGGRWGVAVGDVTGHGIGPALLMAETRAYLRVLALQQDDVASILTAANRVLAEDIGAERFITMLLVALHPEERTLTYANAGHPTGYVLDARGQLKAALRRTGVPLGIRPDTEYVAAPVIRLAPGDLVLLSTDGIEEAMAADDSIFGLERTLDVVRQHRDQPASEVVKALYAAVGRFTQNAPQVDDATAVVIRVR